MPDTPSKLAPAPASIRNATEQLGTYAGESPWQADVSRLDSLLREKKWQWFCAFDERLVIGGAIVSTGYAGKTFVWVFDRGEGRMLADETKTLLQLQIEVADDASHRCIAKARRMWSIEREGVHWRAYGSLGTIDFDIDIDESSLTPMTAICPTVPGKFNVTRKSAGATASGSITVAGRSFKLAGRALLDHSHGLMARETSWLWAIGSGIEMGFNFIDGFNDGLESVVWRADGLRHIPDITIDSELWQVSDPTGAVDLRLDIEGTRREDLHLGLVTSNYTQPIGIWRGSLLGVQFEGFGVAEDHRARW